MKYGKKFLDSEKTSNFLIKSKTSIIDDNKKPKIVRFADDSNKLGNECKCECNIL